MASAIAPRPIALVSTQCPEGHANLAPFSYFMPGGTHPPSLAFSPTLNMQGQPKDTLSNIRETGEFVVNVVTRPMAEGMNQAARGVARHIDEWPLSGFTPLPSELVVPHRIAESPIQFECRLFKIVGHGDGPGSAVYVIGEIVAVHVASALWGESGLVDASIKPIGRMGGKHYIDLAEPAWFDLERPS